MSNAPQSIEIYKNKTLASESAACRAAEILRERIDRNGAARVFLATGNSQLELMSRLVRVKGIDWSKVEAFHLDEYVGIGENHPASFRFWIRTRFAEKVSPKKIHYIDGDSPDLEAMLEAYEEKLKARPIDLAFVGIGENGHIAFNDPPVADFDDPVAVKRVKLDEACRRQQVGEGHFPNVHAVPAEAITVTCTGLMAVKHWICCVPDRRKAEAVQASLEGQISTSCPGSLVQRHQPRMSTSTANRPRFSRPTLCGTTVSS